MNEKGSGAVGCLVILGIILVIAFFVYVCVLDPFLTQIANMPAGGASVPAEGMQKFLQLLGF